MPHYRMATMAVSALGLLALTSEARGQNLGTFTWRLSPFCNVLTLTVVQEGPTFMLSGADNQCGGGAAPAAGTAVLELSGTVAFALTTVRPDGVLQTTRATLSTATFSGPWVDQDGNSGVLLFAPGTASGTPRPVRPRTIATGNDATVGLVVKGNSAAQSANLQQWRDSAGTALAAVKPWGGLSGPLGTLLQHASFSGAYVAQADPGSNRQLADGMAILGTDLSLNDVLDIRSHNATTVPIGLGRPGTFLSLRLKSLGSRVTGQASYIVAGGTNAGDVALQQGFGFKLVAGDALKGVTIANGVETEVDLATTVGSLVPDPSVDLLAVRRGADVEFFVNGALKGTSTTNLPVEAYSLYEVRLVNSATQMGPQALAVYAMTIGFPM